MATSINNLEKRCTKLADPLVLDVFIMNTQEKVSSDLTLPWDLPHER
jgi:hypothetical protein